MSFVRYSSFGRSFGVLFGRSVDSSVYWSCGSFVLYVGLGACVHMLSSKLLESGGDLLTNVLINQMVNCRLCLVDFDAECLRSGSCE